MKEVTKILVRDWGVKELDLDFMGYELSRGDIYTYHHIIKRCDGGSMALDNGAALCGRSSHPYLHMIESVDKETFDAITDELIKINKAHYIVMSSIFRINDYLTDFEQTYKKIEDRKGRRRIKEIYLNRPFRNTNIL